jgi:hypothetical protein
MRHVNSKGLLELLWLLKSAIEMQNIVTWHKYQFL